MPSPWLAERHAYATAPLPERADVVVVGGGIVGCAIALALAEAGREPWVLERDSVAAGASGRNGGLLLPGTAELYLDLARRWGPSGARELWALSERGAARLTAWIAAYDLDCLWRAEGGLHVAASAEEEALLRDNHAALASDGFDVAWLERPELARFGDLPLPPDFRAALLLPGGGPLHSGRLVSGLARAAVRRGARISEGVTVTGVTAGARGVAVATGSGQLSAATVVLAGNAWLASVWPPFRDVITPVRGQVQVTAPLPAGGLRGAWYVNHGYEYFQQLPDRRVVLGGMRWAAPDREAGHAVPDVNPDLQARLSAWFGELFPAWSPLPVTQHWAGIMAFTADRLPLIGRLGDTGRLWVAGGFNGHGLPFAPLAAEIVLAGVTGRTPPAGARWFAPERGRHRRLPSG